MNLYYYNGEILAKETMDRENKKKVFPLLYDIDNADIVPFEVEMEKEKERSRDLIYKKAYIGYKLPTHTDKDEKCLLYINVDKSWECKDLKDFQNTIDFQENKIVFKGYLFPASDKENFEQMKKDSITRMKKEAEDFLNAKVVQYNDYLSILRRTI